MDRIDILVEKYSKDDIINEMWLPDDNTLQLAKIIIMAMLSATWIVKAGGFSQMFNDIKNVYKKIKELLPSKFKKIVSVLESDPEWPNIKKQLTRMSQKQMSVYFKKYLISKGLKNEMDAIGDVVNKYWDELGDY